MTWINALKQKWWFPSSWSNVCVCINDFDRRWLTLYSPPPFARLSFANLQRHSLDIL
jgi:hypothetical protein